MLLLDDKVAVVTGGGSGIGKAIATVFSLDGAAVLVADRDRAKGLETVESIRASGGDAEFFEVDVTDKVMIQAMVDAALQRWGKLDCAVNNAAFNASFAPLNETEDKGWDKTIAATLSSVFYCMRAQIGAMLAGSGGSVVNISSMAAIRGEIQQSPYSAAKSGVLGLTYTAAAEYARQEIRVNAICPGGILTPGIERYFENSPNEKEKLSNSHALGRLGKPEEVAYAASFLCSDRAAFITGHALPVDGGESVNP